MPSFGLVNNTVSTTDTLNFNAAGAFTGDTNRNSSQSYFSQSSANGCFSRSLASAGGVLTSVVDGQGCFGFGDGH